ncbi:MAG: arginine--tRNA ligase [Minisyncoccia bacterium]
MKERLTEKLKAVAASVGIKEALVSLEYPTDPAHGDFSTNVALVGADKLKTSPRVLAEKIVAELKKDAPDFIGSIEIAGPGFVNFKIKDKALAEAVVGIAANKDDLKGPKADPAKKVMVEYTDPNPFKVFHIGHLMSNAIGESLSRLIEHSGAKVIRACYQGDVGLHVAKTIWGIKFFHPNNIKDFNSLKNKGSLNDRMLLLGNAYIKGSGAYDAADLSGSVSGGSAKSDLQKEIDLINKKIFEKSDSEINEIYETGRKWSLEYFDSVYARLGTKFDKLFFESEVGKAGVKAVNEFLGKGVFEKSEGAIVFRGENHGLHTRVFITSHGLPTYEAKELGLNEEKFRLCPDLTESVIVTGNEQDDYFRVLLKVLSLTAPEIAKKTRHLSHGLMRFASGKMSSRKGNIISAESLIDDIKTMVSKKMIGREFSAAEADKVADQVAIAAIKYTILRQSIGGDVIFDSAKSISFEGDSGPYLQYSAVRAQSVLNKAGKAAAPPARKLPDKVGLLERLIARFPDVALRARTEYAPQQVASYLIELAGAFNGFYARQEIINEKDPLSSYYLALTRAFLTTMTEGLGLLGIKVPDKM